MSQPDPADTALAESIFSLGHDLFSMKLYLVSISCLYVYDYLLTINDEIFYIWNRRKNPVFWLFVINRYLAIAVIVINLSSYFAEAWTAEVCARFGFMLTLETTLFTSIAEIFLTMRLYALTKKSRFVIVGSALCLFWQWAIALFTMSQSSKGTENPAVLLSRAATLSLPELPKIDPYHVCIFIGIIDITPWVEAFLCISLAFDGVVFIALTYITLKASSTYRFLPLMKLIQRDGIIYFFVLFSSNLVWLLLFLHSRPGLKFIQNEPAMIISAIMINRITLNLRSYDGSIGAQGEEPSGSLSYGRLRVANQPLALGHAVSQSDYELTTLRGHTKHGSSRKPSAESSTLY